MKHNSNIRLFKIALLIGVLGLSILLGIIVSGAADPEPLFCIGTPIGLLLCFVGAILIIITYTCEIFRGIREKKIHLGDSSFDFGRSFVHPYTFEAMKN